MLGSHACSSSVRTSSKYSASVAVSLVARLAVGCDILTSSSSSASPSSSSSSPTSSSSSPSSTEALLRPRFFLVAGSISSSKNWSVELSSNILSGPRDSIRRLNSSTGGGSTMPNSRSSSALRPFLSFLPPAFDALRPLAFNPLATISALVARVIGPSSSSKSMSRSRSTGVKARLVRAGGFFFFLGSSSMSRSSSSSSSSSSLMITSRPRSSSSCASFMRRIA
mmetsp:Transcript_2912/g.6543  ORF Transcript_2912/g.6543 Transcript_2912/m.6543 type:complete len:224 (-) Transcript_2912:1130-1801(-)